ncbi:hypothetical protein R69749_08261 [Paraburkholderia domus]|nr:hypothetical protein R69619_07677 [Paraburkholderia nemoris]CAE6903104.1 hypothetical protein R69749_08261 [Paraburkholderia domus]
MLEWHLWGRPVSEIHNMMSPHLCCMPPAASLACASTLREGTAENDGCYSVFVAAEFEYLRQSHNHFMRKRVQRSRPVERDNTYSIDYLEADLRLLLNIAFFFTRFSRLRCTWQPPSQTARDKRSVRKVGDASTIAAAGLRKPQEPSATESFVQGCLNRTGSVTQKIAPPSMVRSAHALFLLQCACWRTDPPRRFVVQ